MSQRLRLVFCQGAIKANIDREAQQVKAWVEPNLQLMHEGRVEYRAGEDKCLHGYSDPVGLAAEDINGTKLKNVRRLVGVLSECKDDVVTFGFAGERAELLVLERNDMEDVTWEIMVDNGISPRYSRMGEDMERERLAARPNQFLGMASEAAISR